MPKDVSRRRFLSLSASSIAACALNAHTGLNAPVNPVTLENARPGSTDWQLRQPALNGEIEGYASRTSVAAGESIEFFVSTHAPRHAIKIFRLGWYGGAGSRAMTGVSKFRSHRQPPPVVNRATGLLECRWTHPFKLLIPPLNAPDPWPSGIYVAKLSTRNLGQSYIPFVVREDKRAALLHFQSSVSTFQAYNNWGGKSLYDFNSSDSARAVKVSYNRPYAEGFGSGDLINYTSSWELNLLRFLEREGCDVAYGTSLDTHDSRKLLHNRKAFLSVGHDEYWSKPTRDHVEAARNKGIHLAFFGANAAYTQVRYEPSLITGAPNRTQVCYRNAKHDPLSILDAKSALTTVNWREPNLNRPEEELLGVQFVHSSVNTDLVVDHAGHWFYAGTGLKNGDKLKGLCGYEADSISGLCPFELTRLAHSPVSDAPNAGFADMTLYRHPSGAIVYAAGTNQWAWGLDDYATGSQHLGLLSPAAQQATRNLLAQFTRNTPRHNGSPDF